MKARRGIFTFLIILFASVFSNAQEIHHWETVVLANEQWKYFPGTSDPGANWFSPSFDDSGWLSGAGGVGYGDNDDGTIINPAISVFLRKKFSIVDVLEIEEVILHLDYDDGFVAYINGVEIARRNVGTSTTVPFSQGSTGLHEAVLFNQGVPEAFSFSDETKSALIDGENVLAIQVHNESLGSSDLSSSAFLSVGVNTSIERYQTLPAWFVLPLDFKSSNLPIIAIETGGKEIQDETRIVATMGIVDNGADVRNFITDPFNNFNGNISIELRGESSQGFPKKSLTIETQDATGNNLNAALLNLPPENDWVLYAPFTDKTMMRDVLAYKMGRDLGGYAPNTRYVELVLNGSYLGVYVLIEKIKIDKKRVNIATLRPEDTSGDELTGGYLLRVDQIDPNDFPAWVSVPSPKLPNENNISFQFSDPDGEDLVVAQRSYIRDFIFDFESALSSSAFNTANGYQKFIDVNSFIDFMIVNEIGKNIDGYVFSTYMHKDKDSDGGLLKMGPLWDFNLAFGNVDYLPNSQFAPGWTYNDQYRMYWFRRLMQDPAYKKKFNCRWKQVRNTKLTDDYFSSAIDSIATLLNEAQQRNYQQWNILGVYVWPNQFVGQTYTDEVNFLKSWIQTRLDWMDANTTVSDCDPVTGIEYPGASMQIKVFPNPSEGELHIQTEKQPGGQTRLNILSSKGERILDEPFDGDFTWTPKQNVSAGIYLVRIYDTTGEISLQKVIIK
jgi:hypothetical protein